jgi:NAD(P)-dependent dehydrogenase (short-subunit alcohol dehydrogenase family)
MTDRPTILLTGATDGIGYLAAIELARGGADLILTARDKIKAEKVRAAIADAAPTASVDLYYVDFADLAAVVATGRAIAALHPRIDVLINNAGLHAFEQRVTKDGFAEMIAVNYFAPWLLTAILRETLVRSAPSRVVIIGSEASRQYGGMHPADDLVDTKPFTARGSSKIYGLSKLLDIMFSLELARQLKGKGVAVNALCPGFNVTGLGRELGFARPLAALLKCAGIGNPARGAGIMVRLATDAEYGERSGDYVSARNKRLAPVAPADDEVSRRELWDTTAQLLSRFLSPFAGRTTRD